MQGTCGCGRTDAEWVPDPFVAEIHDEIEMRWLCGDCYYDLCMST